MSMTPASKIGKRIAKSKVMAVVVLDDAEHGVPLAESLLSVGIDALELTLRTPAALPALEKIRSQVPDMLIGAGTILKKKQVDEVLDAGAHFGVAPGLNPTVVRYAKTKKLPFGPGVMTPSDVDQSIALGCRLMKFFPAESSGGLNHLTNIASPFEHLDIGFLPLGGLSERNMADYLASPFVTAIGGSWLAPRDLIAKEDWKKIANIAAKARFLADG